MVDRTGQLERTPLFGGLSHEDIRPVAEMLREESYRRRSTVYRQGELDASFYMIVSGRLRVRQRDERGEERTLNYLQSGDSFGEHSLLTGEKRDVTIDVEEDAVLLCLKKEEFDRLLDRFPQLGDALGMYKLERLRKVPLFERLAPEDVQRIAALMGRTSFRRGAIVCRQGELGSSFYIIESGSVELRAGDDAGEAHVIAILQDGDSFGERSLMTGEPRDTTVRALKDTSLFYLNQRDFNRLLGDYPSLKEALNIEAQMRGLAVTHRFRWQREDEVLVVLSHRHIYAFLRRLWLPMLPLLALTGVSILALTAGWATAWLYALFATYAAVGIVASLLVAWFFLDWRNDYLAVTNKRVVHVEKVILLQESRNEAPLESIQEIFILTPGIIARMLGINDLSIQTAGARGRTTFSTLPNAAWVRDRIFEQSERASTEGRTQEKEAIRRRLELELGRAEPEVSRFAEPEEAPPVTAPQTPPDIDPGRTALSDRVQLFRSYLLPRMRVEEAGVVTWRKHWFILIDKTAGPLLLVLILLLLGLAAVLELLPPTRDLGSVFWVVFLTGLLVGPFLLWYRYEDWRNDIYQLTDDRIRDVEKLPLGLREERREASLDMIQDIRYEIPGIMANLLHYGNVVITTAAREATFTFDWVHHPHRVQEEIFARLDAFREKERQQEREGRTVELLDWFATYTDLDGEQQEPEQNTGN